MSGGDKVLCRRKRERCSSDRDCECASRFGRPTGEALSVIGRATRCAKELGIGARGNIDQRCTSVDNGGSSGLERGCAVGEACSVDTPVAVSKKKKTDKE